jgi:hypothetical protein
VASATVVVGSAVAIANESGTLGEKYPSTALAAVLGGAPSLTSEVSTLWHNPIFYSESTHVIQFVSSLKHAHAGMTLLLTPNVETEALLHLGIANAVGASQPCQESLSSQGPGRAAQEVRALRPGGILVTSNVPTDAGVLLPIEQYTLTLLRDRFTLREIAADGHGMRAFRMTKLALVTTPPPAAPSPPLGQPGCA